MAIVTLDDHKDKGIKANVSLGGRQSSKKVSDSHLCDNLNDTSVG